MLRLSILILCLLSCKPATTLTHEAMTADYSYHTLEVDGNVLPYRMLLPENYDKNKAYPLILFLHGAGERGNDNELQLVHGSARFLDEVERAQYPAIIVFPQCAEETTWSGYLWNDGDIDFNHDSNDSKLVTHQILIKALIAELNQNYKLDHHRFYIGGLTMGGMGTFETVRQNPGLFAAAFPICGGADPKIAQELTGPSWWIFHGEEDEVVKSAYSAEMAKALKAEGADVQLTMYPGVGHDSWNQAFAEPLLMEWLFGQRRIENKNH